jgi:hypothetical protein
MMRVSRPLWPGSIFSYLSLFEYNIFPMVIVADLTYIVCE